MKKILLFSLIVTLSSLTINAKEESNKTPNMDSFSKIEKIFRKRLRKKCSCTSVCLAQKHTRKEWKQINKRGLFKDEFKRLCPRGVGILDDDMIESLFRFSYEYAKGSDTHREL